MASIAMKALGHIGLSTQLPLITHDSGSGNSHMPFMSLVEITLHVYHAFPC